MRTVDQLKSITKIAKYILLASFFGEMEYYISFCYFFILYPLKTAFGPNSISTTVCTYMIPLCAVKAFWLMVR